MMSLILAAVLTVTILPFNAVPALAAVTPDISWYDETQTEYTLMNEAELFGMAYLMSTGTDERWYESFDGKTIKLGADITLTQPWVPAGLLFEGIPYSGYDAGSSFPFRGVFDGCGHTISNVVIDDSDWPITTTRSVGFISFVDAGEIINTNLSIERISVRRQTQLYYTGGMAGQFYYQGSIENCHVASQNGGKITVESDNTYGYIGGLFGGGLFQDGIISNCSADIDINYTHTDLDADKTRIEIGGLIGEAGAPISNCRASGNISVSRASAKIDTDGGHYGGLVGFAYASVEDSYATGNVTVPCRGSVGGLAGAISGSSSIGRAAINCHATGTVNGGDRSGGLAGYIVGNVIRDCSATGDVSTFAASNAYTMVGGLAGSAGNMDLSVASNCWASGNVTNNGAYEITRDNNVAGGLFGSFSGSVESCYATGSVTARANAGGFVGYLYASNSHIIKNCYALGKVTVNDAINGSCVGGFVGSTGGASISNCFAHNDIEVNGTVSTMSVGGMIGNEHDSNNRVIEQCHHEGDITIKDAKMSIYDDTGVGGFIGMSRASYGILINHCYSVGAIDIKFVTGYNSDRVGGFVGSFYTNGYTSTLAGNNRIENCYTASQISIGVGLPLKGAFAGYVGNNQDFEITPTRPEPEPNAFSKVIAPLEIGEWPIGEYRYFKPLFQYNNDNEVTLLQPFEMLTTNSYVIVWGEQEFNNYWYASSPAFTEYTPKLKNPGSITKSNITSVEPCTTISVGPGVPFELLPLPVTMSATAGGADKTLVTKWNIGGYKPVPGVYNLTGGLFLPSDISNAGSMTSTIQVIVTSSTSIDRVEISGAAKVDARLTATGYSPSGAIDAGALTFQWQIADAAEGPYADIAGAQSAEYTPSAADVNKYLRINVTLNNVTKAAITTAVELGDFTTASILAATPSDGKITLNWTAANPLPDSYNIYWMQSDTAINAAALKSNAEKISGAVSPGDFTGLINRKDYYFLVEAVKAGYSNSDSEVLKAVPVGKTPLPAPTGLTWSGNTASFTGSSPDNNVAGYEISLYKDTALIAGSAETLIKSGAYSKDYTALIAANGDGTYAFQVTAKADPADNNFMDSATVTSSNKTVSTSTGGEINDSDYLMSSFGYPGDDVGKPVKSSLSGIYIQFKGNQPDMLMSDLTEIRLEKDGVSVPFQLNNEIIKNLTPQTIEGETLYQTHFYIAFQTRLTDPGTYIMYFKFKGNAHQTLPETVGSLAQKEPLPAPAGLAWSGDLASFAGSSPEDNVTGYEISLYKDTTLIAGSSDTILMGGAYSKDYAALIAANGAGYYTFKVIAKADPNDLVYADSAPAVSEEYNYDVPPFLAADGVTVTLGMSTIKINDMPITATALVTPDNAGPIAYKWTSAPAGAVTFANDTAAIAVITGKQAGSATITCTVTNTLNGTSVSDSKTLTILNNEADILAFNLAGHAGEFTTSGSALAVALTIPDTIDITNIAAEFQLSPGAAAEVNGFAQISRITMNDFTDPVIYSITSEDGTVTKQYDVYVSQIALLPLDTPSGLSISNDGTASWSAVSGSMGYLVQLYCDGAAISEAVSTSLTSFNVLSEMKAYGAGVYSFTVTAVADPGINLNSAESAAGGNFVMSKIISIEAPEEISDVLTGTTQMSAGLPDTVTAVLDTGASAEIPATWRGYDSSAAGTITLTGTLGILPNDVVNSDGVACPDLSISFIKIQYTVTFESNGGTTIKPQVVISGQIAKQPEIPVRENYTFSGWYKDSGLTQAYDFTVPVVSSFTLYAKWLLNSVVTPTAEPPYAPPSGYQVPPAAPPSNQDTPNVDVNGNDMKAERNPDGSLSYTLSEDNVLKALDGKNELVIVSSGETDVQITLPLKTLDEAKATVTIKLDFGCVSLSNDLIAYLRSIYGDTITLTFRKGSFIVEMKRGSQAVEYNNPSHPLTLTLPYSLANGQNAGAVVAVKKAGADVILPLAMYKNGYVTFNITATGRYDIKYNKKTFTDVNSHWAADYITFTSARDLFTGVGNNKFSPDASMTRAMFAQVLSNLDGANLGAYGGSRFNDVNGGAWYAAAVEWAADNGIVSGTGNGGFNPNANINREQMAVMIVNYAKYKGYTLPNGAASTFNDEMSINAWAYNAVKMIQAAGIVSGKPGNIYDPEGTATRAEVAAIFANFVKIYSDNVK